MSEPTPEERAREVIDRQLALAGWVVQDRVAMNLAAGRGVAVREFMTDAGPCDYLLFVDQQPLGVIEAKKAGTVLTGYEAQTLEYASKIPARLQPKLRPLPFRYESTGAETRFTNGLEPNPRSRRVFWYHQPETLLASYSREVALRAGRPSPAPASTLIGCMNAAPPLNTVGMWPAQIRAVTKLEEAIRAGKRRALLQMATGAGKTFTIVSALFRLLRFGHATRVLFLVDRPTSASRRRTSSRDTSPPTTERRSRRTSTSCARRRTPSLPRTKS